VSCTAQGRRRGTGALTGLAVVQADPVEQVVGLHRLAAIGDQPKHARPDWRQPQAALMAGGFNRGHERRGVMDVVLGIDAGVS